ncbi:response regulator [Flammeovirga aprica]|uniref:Response regulator n=1 Tax=Flammeovirga aprica JL-4 TaxID=694437 RepID=A0A7X9P0Y6_9BACT|nr:response regulator [Flammeovirga aprica]NME67556.1 response regulator [Flammeovirga aprica JL-4]
MTEKIDKKLDKVLIVDDSAADIFIMKRVIDRAEVTNEIVVKHGVKEALDYLSTKENNEYPNPNIIFLDINMPNKTGWDFLDEYETLDKDMRADVIICMVTTSKDPSERERAKKFNVVGDFTNKPLTKEKIFEIIEENFLN